MLCYGAGDGTGEIGTGGVEGEEKICSQSARFPGPLARLAGSSCWDKAPSAGERLGREVCGIHKRWGQAGRQGGGVSQSGLGAAGRRTGGQEGRVREGCCRGSVAELEGETEGLDLE